MSWFKRETVPLGPQVAFTVQESVSALAKVYPERFYAAGIENGKHSVDLEVFSDGVVLITQKGRLS